MDFRPSESQQLLAATARDFLRKHCPPERLDELAETRASRASCGAPWPSWAGPVF